MYIRDLKCIMFQSQHIILNIFDDIYETSLLMIT